MIVNSFPRFVDDSENPENYYLKIYKDDDEKKLINSLPHREREFKYNEINKNYYTRIINFSDFVDKRVEWIKKQTKEELSKENELRKNIRVLIILGSAIERINSFNPTFIKNNEDIVTTLLIQHLFKFAFGIPEEQIFLTSTNPDNFPSSPYVILSSILKNKDDINLFPNFNDENDVLYSNPNDFQFFQTVFAQVGEFQYHFQPSYIKYPPIYLFDKESLSSFQTDENSELFVFFLDHETPTNFQVKNYEFYVERLLEMPSKHLYIFNDSSNSGSLIDLFHISDKIYELFFDESNSHTNKTSFTKIFTMLMEISHPSFNCSILDDLINNKTKTYTTESKKEINKLDIENKKKEMNISEIMKYLAKTSDKDKNDLISLIEHLKIYDSDLSIDPFLFHKLKEKSFILCSCPNNFKSQSLPLRDFYIGYNETISSHGSVFSSIIIECLFNTNIDDIKPQNFISHVQTIHNNMKKQFFPILKEQYTYSPSSNENRYLNCMISQNKLSESDIKADCQHNIKFLESYFNINYANDNLFICPDNITLPNMKSILLPKQYWNVDITPVDNHEYDNIKIYNYEYYDQKYKQTKEGYGPIKGFHNLIKLINDFSDCLEHKIHLINPSIQIDWDMKHFDDKEEYSDITKDCFKLIEEKMQHIFTPKIHRAFDKLKTIIQYQLEYDFKEQLNLYISCCVETLEQILPLYKNIEFGAF